MITITICVYTRARVRGEEMFEIPACPRVRYPVVWIHTHTRVYTCFYIHIAELFTFVGGGERKKKFAIKYKARPDERDCYHRRLSP